MIILYKLNLVCTTILNIISISIRFRNSEYYFDLLYPFSKFWTLINSEKT